jgi:hypothetical protein
MQDGHTPQTPKAPPDGTWLASRLFADYFWFILKNVLGWTLILLAWPVGLLVPGPGGIPIFLIGFALVTFPGKRSLTARVLRGRQMDLRQRRVFWITCALAALLPTAAYWIFKAQRNGFVQWLDTLRPSILLAAFGAACCVAWLLVKFGLLGVNVIIHWIPAVRRKVRPWMRDHGIDLLPPRRRRRLGHRYPGEVAGALAEDIGQPDPEEILHIDERHQARVRNLWSSSKGFVKRFAGIAFAVAIFAWLARRVAQHWHEIDQQVMQINVLEVFAASVLFAIFLVTFRMVTWWRIMAGLGYRLPFAPALRIWSMSELARYVGSGISQMIGRVYLCKPYGCDPGTTSASQLLELVLFLLANILVGVGCTIWLGVKIDGMALSWFYVAVALIPLLLAVLHPRVFYGILNMVLGKLKKQPVTARLSAPALVGLLLWNVVGLFFQGWTIWLVIHRSLDLKPQHWWVTTGAYCLAWMAGFIAVWAQAGLGVREPVFVLAAWVALPDSVRPLLKNPKGILMFLGMLLRVWATVGELMLALVAYFLDYRGAAGRADAPGRVSTDVPAAPPTVAARR